MPSLLDSPRQSSLLPAEICSPSPPPHHHSTSSLHQHVSKNVEDKELFESDFDLVTPIGVVEYIPMEAQRRARWYNFITNVKRIYKYSTDVEFKANYIEFKKGVLWTSDLLRSSQHLHFLPLHHFAS